MTAYPENDVFRVDYVGCMCNGCEPTELTQELISGGVILGSLVENLVRWIRVRRGSRDGTHPVNG